MTPSPVATAREWTPDQPLRADATDEQMGLRFQWLWAKAGLTNLPHWTSITREFAAADLCLWVCVRGTRRCDAPPQSASIRCWQESKNPQHEVASWQQRALEPRKSRRSRIAWS